MNTKFAVCACEIDWTLFVDLMGSVATILAAAIAAWVTKVFTGRQNRIARRAAQTANEKLRLDLFDKRMEIVQAIGEALNEQKNKGGIIDRILINNLAFQKARSHWMFGDDVTEHLQKVIDKAIEAKVLFKRLPGIQKSSESGPKWDEYSAMTSWIYCGFEKELAVILQKYLKFDTTQEQ